MTKKRITKQSVRQSAKQRREAERQRRQGQLNLVISIVAGVLIVIVAFVVGRQILASGDAEDAGSTVGAGTLMSSDRPLADLPPASRNDYFTDVPEMVIDTSKNYEAVIRLEKGGAMRLSLFDDEAPLTVNNFVFLANQGYYDGTIFHRVISGFMAQGGDPSGLGTGGPGYTFQDETDNGLTFEKSGMLAMANSGPNTNGSQFFITFVPTPHLNGAHTIFGELIEGEDVLNSINFVEPDLTAAEPRGDLIERIEIYEQ